MVRQWRIEYDDAVYHVLSRGNAGNSIFKDEEDQISFLNIMGEMVGRFQIEIYAYVLMDNHYHLILRTLTSNISKAMQWFGSTYTRRYNMKHKRSGHLFQGRYKTFLVEDNEYLLRLSCYIHRNPVRAKIVGRLSEYPWSSYNAYAYGNISEKFLRTGLILSLVNWKNENYREIMQNYSYEEDNIWENLRHGLIFGSEKFTEQMRLKYLTEKLDAEVPQKKHLVKNPDPGTLLKKATSILKCDIPFTLPGTRISEAQRDNRDLMVYLLWCSGWYKNREIGTLFGIGNSSVSRRVSTLKSKIEKEPLLKSQFSKIKPLIEE